MVTISVIALLLVLDFIFFKDDRGSAIKGLLWCLIGLGFIVGAFVVGIFIAAH